MTKATATQEHSHPLLNFPKRSDVRPSPRANREHILGDAKAALDAALDRKALEPVLLDVGSICSYAEYMLIVSGRSDRQVEAIASAIIGDMKKRGVSILGSEGAKSGQWALLDFGDFVVHVFLHANRDHYDLESLWLEAKRLEIEVPDDARIPADDYSY